MSTRARTALAIWLVALAIAGGVIARARFVADMSSFLPPEPTKEQRSHHALVVFLCLVIPATYGVAAGLKEVRENGQTPLARAD